MKHAASTRNRAAHLADLYNSLRQRETFSGEDERMRWRWRLHYLQRQHEHEQQEMPEAWMTHMASLLTAIENQISALPLESDSHTSRNRAASAAAAISEFCLVVTDNDDQQESELIPLRRGSIPIMENEVLVTMEEIGRGSWDTLGCTLGTPTRSSVRDRGRSLPLSRMSLSEFDAVAVRDEEATGDNLSLAVAASNQLSFIGEEANRSSVRDRGRSLPLSRMSLSEFDAAVRDEEATGDDLSLAVAASSRRSSMRAEEKTVERESLGLGNSVPRLLRSMVNYLGLSMEETFLCQICYDYASTSTSYALSACGHTFCETCLKSYLEFKVSEGQVYPKCFFEKPENKTACKTDISVDDIHSLVSEEVWQKYNKFKFNKEHVLARQCPYCDHSQLCAGSDHPECICEACNHEFCFVHSSAHQGRTCAQYDKKMIAVEKLNNALISEISKPCPGCQNNVEKTGGCNQMKCVVCNASFCWICLKIIDDSVFPEHFQWWNIRGCAGDQMANIEGQGAIQKGIGMVTRVVFFMIFGPPAFVLAAIFCILCCCFIPCTASARFTFRQAFTTCFCTSGYILAAPVVLALGLVALAIFIGSVAAGAAVFVCVSPVVGLVLLFRREKAIDPALSLRHSGHVEVDPTGDIEGATDVSPRDQMSPRDQTFFSLSS